MTKKISYQITEAFRKDFKKLTKKFKTLLDDLEVAKRNAIELFHLNQVDNRSIVLIPGYCDEDCQIYKLRKFACKALKGKGVRSGIRIIYAYWPQRKTVAFIQIYLKSAQKNEAAKRIEKFMSEDKPLRKGCLNRVEAADGLL